LDKIIRLCEKHGISYRTAWNHYKAGQIPNAKKLPSGLIIVDDEMINSRYALISKQHRLKPPPLHISKLKKEKGGFFSFRFKTTSLRPRYIGRMSGALCDLWGTWEGTNKGVDHAKRIARRYSTQLKKTAQT
jgi:hypothetical protein